MKGQPIVGTLFDVLRDPPGHVLRCARALGDVCDLGVTAMPIVLVSHPDQIEEILVTNNKLFVKDKGTHDLSVILGNGLLTSEGDFWRRQRRLAQPAFHRDRIHAYGEVMVSFTERTLARLRDGETRNLHADLMKLTMEIVAKTLFDADVAGEAKDVGDALEVVVHRFASVRPGLMPWLDRLPTPGNRRFQRAADRLDAIIYGIIRERRDRGRDTGDLLSMLMAARDEDESRMSDRQLRDEAMTLFLAGHETTALALSWAFCLLSQSPEAERRLVAELALVLAGRAPTVADLPKLRFTDAVIAEAMRLYPPAWAIGREALADLTVGGYDVPKGTQVWLSQYVVHRDPRYFDEPERFLPERWEGDLRQRLPKYAYFPFGGGPRLCIGHAFATMEAVLLLATIAQRFRVRLVPGHPIDTVAAVTLRPKHGVMVTLEERRAASARD